MINLKSLQPLRANVKHVSVICKFGMCHEIIPGSSNGGFSVVKHLYSLEIALHCYKELQRNVLDFWSRFQTEKPPKTAHFTIACTICGLHTEFPRGRDDIREARSNFTASQIDQSEALSLFQPRTNNRKSLAQGSPELFSLSVMRKREEFWGREWMENKKNMRKRVVKEAHFPFSFLYFSS